MKKALLITGVIIILAAAGGTGYALLGHKDKTTTTTAHTATVASTPPKQLNLTTLLAKLKAKYPTVQQSYVYSEVQDPNDELGKAGYYTAGANFYDTRTNYTPEQDGNTAFGAECGGAIEVYTTASDAAKRVAYLQQFQGDPTLDPGAAKQVGAVVVRASSQYTASEQADMINFLAAQVQAQL